MLCANARMRDTVSGTILLAKNYSTRAVGGKLSPSNVPPIPGGSETIIARLHCGVVSYVWICLRRKDFDLFHRSACCIWRAYSAIRRLHITILLSSHRTPSYRPSCAIENQAPHLPHPIRSALSVHEPCRADRTFDAAKVCTYKSVAISNHQSCPFVLKSAPFFVAGRFRGR